MTIFNVILLIRYNQIQFDWNLNKNINLVEFRGEEYWVKF